VLLKIKKIKFFCEKLLLRTPFINKIIQTYNITNICRTVALLLNGGTTVVLAFLITEHTTTNLIYKEGLDRIREGLTKGDTISEYMHKNQNLFPLMMSQIISVGERTGKLVDTFSYLSEVYEGEMDDITRNLSTTLEPALLIFMGVLVGFVAISIITPIYGLTQHLTPR
jgi:type II secretory pathway component PulF